MLDLLEWAKRFVATPSVSRDGNAAIAGLASDLLAEIGLTSRLERVVHDGVEHFLLIADIPAGAGGERDGGLILLTHLDTVPPGELDAWTATGGDPFRPTVEGDALFGLGSADAKVDLVCKAAALEQVDRGRLRRPIRVVGTFAEEIGLLGARHFVERGGARGFRYALIGEPSELVGIRAHKGYAVFEATLSLTRVEAGAGTTRECVLRGRAAHSSTPHLGENAIDAALARLRESDVRGVRGLEGGGAVNVVPDRAVLSLDVAADGQAEAGGAASPAYDPTPLVQFHQAWRERLIEVASVRDADFDPDHTVGNLGKIQLRDGSCVIRFDLRPVPGVDVREVVRPLERLAKVELVRRNPPLATSASGPLVGAVQEAQRAAGVEPRILTKATCTEAGLLAESGELEAVVLGAGVSIGNVHRPNEYTVISQLAQARDIYRGLIERLCGEGS